MLITNRYKDQNLALSREIVTYIQQKGGSGDICVSSVEDDDEKGFDWAAFGGGLCEFGLG